MSLKGQLPIRMIVGCLALMAMPAIAEQQKPLVIQMGVGGNVFTPPQPKAEQSIEGGSAGFHATLGLHSEIFLPNLRIDLSFDQYFSPDETEKHAVSLLQLHIRGFGFRPGTTLNPFIGLSAGGIRTHGIYIPKNRALTIPFNDFGIVLGGQSGLEVSVSNSISILLAFGYRFTWIPRAVAQGNHHVQTDVKKVDVKQDSFQFNLSGFHTSATLLMHF